MSDRAIATLLLVLAVGILILSWANYQVGIADGICQAHGYDRHADWTGVTERPLRCESTVYEEVQ